MAKKAKKAKKAKADKEVSETKEAAAPAEPKRAAKAGAAAERPKWQFWAIVGGIAALVLLNAVLGLTSFDRLRRIVNFVTLPVVIGLAIFMSRER